MRSGKRAQSSWLLQAIEEKFHSTPSLLPDGRSAHSRAVISAAINSGFAIHPKDSERKDYQALLRKDKNGRVSINLALRANRATAIASDVSCIPLNSFAFSCNWSVAQVLEESHKLVYRKPRSQSVAVKKQNNRKMAKAATAKPKQDVEISRSGASSWSPQAPGTSVRRKRETVGSRTSACQTVLIRSCVLCAGQRAEVCQWRRQEIQWC